MSVVSSVVTGKSFKYIHIVDSKSSSANGGTFTAGAWQTRDLNTIKTDETGSVSLSSNQFTLPAGTYCCEIHAPAKNVARHQARLRNITDSNDELIGTSEEASSQSQNKSSIFGKFTISANKTFEVQHKCASTQSSNGFGSGGQVGLTELFTVVQLWKVDEFSVLSVECQ